MLGEDSMTVQNRLWVTCLLPWYKGRCGPCGASRSPGGTTGPSGGGSWRELAVKEETVRLRRIFSLE